MGVAVNERPELFHGVIAQVPFVDVVTTMLDETIPLTTGEFEEWGNPQDETYYHYMKSYSPYDGVRAQAYPHMLVTTGLHDSQVQYWEPAKWVAKLRELKPTITCCCSAPIWIPDMAENPGASKAMKGWRWSTPFHRPGAGDTAGKSGSVGAIPRGNA